MSVAKRFRELIDKEAGGHMNQTATLEDLLDLAAIVDDELAKASPVWKDGKQLIEQYVHTEGNR